MRVYLDSCCYNRPFDDLEQEVVRIESEAILNILAKGVTGEYEVIGSDALDYELHQIGDPIKRQNVIDLYEDNIKFQIEESEEINLRAKDIRNQSSIHFFDSLQIAYAEASGSKVMLTTDYKLEKNGFAYTAECTRHQPSHVHSGRNLWNTGDEINVAG